MEHGAPRPGRGDRPPLRRPCTRRVAAQAPEKAQAVAQRPYHGARTPAGSRRPGLKPGRLRFRTLDIAACHSACWDRGICSTYLATLRIATAMARSFRAARA